jgi:hypothetical protein
MSEKAPHPEHEDRNADGTVRVGNQTARKHGVHAFEARGAAALPADLRVSVDEFRVQVISDRGGVDNLTAIEGGYIRRLSELETVARLLTSDLALRGLFTPRGRVRGTFSRWLETLDRWDRYAQRVGVDRRARQISTLQAYLEQRTADAAGDEGHTQEPAQ